MKIVADENILFADDAFGQFGQVLSVNARDIDRPIVRDADILLVRSVTAVGKELLEGSSVRFVGTATIGVDHVDEVYLAGRNIKFVSAPGTSSTAVAEYVVSALLAVSEKKKTALAGSTLAVIGVGSVGSISARYAEALGMKVLLNDPPLARGGSPSLQSLDEVIEADYVTVHVPLTRTGPDRTFHLFGRENLRKMKEGAVIINSARGAVVDNTALGEQLAAGTISAVLDVWEEEPEISVELLERTALATPHIAGYSLDAKLNGTTVVYRALCDFLGREPSWNGTGLLPAPPIPELLIRGDGRPTEEIVREAVLSVYDIEADDARLRKMKDASTEERPRFFAGLRTSYPLRREFANTAVRLTGCPPAASGILNRLGFSVISQE